jgi:putative proteasome-type protease
MTYCVGLLLNQGPVMASDSRTNAGVDQISSYSKLHLFQPSPDRYFVLLAAGNLATTREVMDRLRRDLDRTIVSGAESGGPSNSPVENLATVQYLFEAALYIGRINREVQRLHGPALREVGAAPEATFILGGRIGNEPPGLLLIYPQGNAIAATSETPYLQIGESKFGKSELDRFARTGMSLEDGARLCLVSLESTARANLTVARPYEVVLCPNDWMGPSQRLRLADADPDLVALTDSWEAGQRRAFETLPRFSWEVSDESPEI